MFDPLTIGLGIVAWLAVRKQGQTQFGALTPQREEIFKNAMAHLMDPRRMVQLATEFQQQGLNVQAYLLRKRAEWRSRSPEQRRAHEVIFHKAMASENIEAIAAVANAFEAQTATSMAEKLRERIIAIQKQTIEKARADAQKQAEATAPVKPATQATAPAPVNGMSGHTEVVSKNVGPQEKSA